MSDTKSEKTTLCELLAQCRDETMRTSNELKLIRDERDNLQHNLFDARKNFAEFQSEKEQQLRENAKRMVS